MFVAAGGGVERFSAAGAPLPFECKTLACSKYVERNKLTGTSEGGFGEVASVAVDDRTGEVFVSTGSAVDVFSSTGEYLSQVTEVAKGPVAAVYGPLQRAAGLAFDQETGELYLAVENKTEPGEDVVDVFEAKAPGKLEYVSQFGAGVLSSDWRAYADGGGRGRRGAEAGNVYVTRNRTRNACRCVQLIGYVWKRRGRAKKHRQGRSGPTYLYVGIDPVSGRVYVADSDHHVLDEFAGSVSEEYLGRLTGTPTGAGGSKVAFTGAECGCGRGVRVGMCSSGIMMKQRRQGSWMCLPRMPMSRKSPRMRRRKVGVESAQLNGVVTLVKEHATCRFVWGTSTSELSKLGGLRTGAGRGRKRRSRGAGHDRRADAGDDVFL